MTAKGNARARRNEAVAKEARSAAEGDTPTPTAPARAQEAVTEPEQIVRRCCFTAPVVLRTTDLSAETIDYCAKHLPVNLSQ